MPGYRPCCFTWHDLVNRPDEIVAEIFEHSPSRRALLAADRGGQGRSNSPARTPARNSDQLAAG
jgi:hypothetical protein